MRTLVRRPCRACQFKGAASAFNADMNNWQLHPDERRRAADLARKSGGRYTQEDIENALRHAGNTYSWHTPTTTGAVSTNAPRDRLTGMPLDDQGRYSRTVVLDGKMYEPKYHSCATPECMNSNANLDMNDPATQAYVRALDQKVFKDIGTGRRWGRW